MDCSVTYSLFAVNYRWSEFPSTMKAKVIFRIYNFSP